GRVLDKEVQKVKYGVRQKVEGKLATGQCDGWKNVAKSSIVSSVMTVENMPYLIQTHDVTRDPKTGDHLFKLVLQDIELMEKEYGVEVIAWCTDDGPDGKKMRRLLQAQFPWLITLLCWAHQINLVVGDVLSVRGSVTEDISNAVEVIKWFNNHGAALALLRQEQILTFAGSFWALVLPIITRWTAYYLAVTRVLKLKQPLQLCWTRNEDRLITCAGTKEELKEKAREIQRIVNDHSFWYRLARIQCVLEPLAIAANVSQASHTRLDHILLTLGNLFRQYSYVFIVAVFLNPYIRGKLFRREFLMDAQLYSMVERVYERVMRCKADFGFMDAYEDYKRSRGEFLDGSMSLQLMKRRFTEANLPLDLQRIWSRIDKGTKPCDDGQNGLAKLAIHIFAVVANSAGCERAFSNFGITHTKLRNKLNAQKVHKAATIRMEQQCADREAGLARSRKKRKFGETMTGADPSNLPPSDSTVTDPVDSPQVDFLQYAESLLQQVEESNDDDNQNSPPIQPNAPSSSSSRKTQISLANLFDYTLSAEEGLEFHWPGGKKNLEADLLAHERVLADELSDSST
ncbi:hypothetical protein M413DRAFT_79560, partial [Hebeloma cylindrosporum]